VAELEAPKLSHVRTALVAGGLLVGPHALCLLGVGGGLGIGGYALHRWCSHSSENFGIPLRKLSVIPANRVEFTGERAILAEKRLLAAEPRFNQVIEQKAKDAEGEPIKVVFFEAEGDKKVSVVFCKNGALCPCSKPELFEVGHRSSLAEPEAFAGQHGVLEALYFGK